MVKSISPAVLVENSQMGNRFTKFEVVKVAGISEHTAVAEAYVKPI